MRGKYIVIEGPEGVGKTTQLHELVKRLETAGLPVRTLREPDSQSDLTSRAIRHLTQDPRYPMNTKTEVLLYNAARSQSLDIIRQSITQGVICVVDRNYLTTLAIQYYGRGDVPDYQTISSIISFAVGDMEPDLTIVMDAPVTTLQERLKDRFNGERFDNLESAFLERVRAGYLWEANQRKLPVVFATESRDQISREIWELVSKTLAIRDTHAAKTTEPVSIKQIIDNKAIPAPHEPPFDKSLQATSLPESDLKPIPEQESPIGSDRPYLTKTGHGLEITPAGKDWLRGAITNTESNVYATLSKLESVTAAAAMARLSRRGDDMRITILDEFANSVEKQDEKLLKRVISAYGDDSVQQLVAQHIVVENASNLLTKKLEWGRMGSYLEQSTRYIYFDQKDETGNFRYHTPDYFNQELKQQYTDAMNTIFELYSVMVRGISAYVRTNSNTPKDQQDSAWMGATRAQACDAVRTVLPVATRSTVGIFASGQALESLIMHLLADELQEARETGQLILEEARKVIPMFLERADIPERGGAMIAYSATTAKQIKQLARDYLPDNFAPSHQAAVVLTDYYPKNELSLVADMLYDSSSLSLSDITDHVTSWSYEKRLSVFQAYMGDRLNRRHKPGRAIEHAHYSWDIVCDYGIFRDLQRHRMVDDLNWQELSPRYGYEIPSLVEDAGMVDQYEACFDISLKLYSLLQQSGYTLEAQYATLLGHKMRWKISYNAREAFHIHELRTGPQGHPGYRKLVLEMHQKLTEVHPLLAEAMKFVNKGEDEALTRLAAERYAQYKLNKLDNS